jgi:hypothetical protein
MHAIDRKATSSAREIEMGNDVQDRPADRPSTPTAMTTIKLDGEKKAQKRANTSKLSHRSRLRVCPWDKSGSHGAWSGKRRLAASTLPRWAGSFCSGHT